LLGSTAAEGLPRIGRTSIATRWAHLLERLKEAE
jgi:hypothetical protein